MSDEFSSDDGEFMDNVNVIEQKIQDEELQQQHSTSATSVVQSQVPIIAAFTSTESKSPQDSHSSSAVHVQDTSISDVALSPRKRQATESVDEIVFIPPKSPSYAQGSLPTARKIADIDLEMFELENQLDPTLHRIMLVKKEAEQKRSQLNIMRNASPEKKAFLRTFETNRRALLTRLSVLMKKGDVSAAAVVKEAYSKLIARSCELHIGENPKTEYQIESQIRVLMRELSVLVSKRDSLQGSLKKLREKQFMFKKQLSQQIFWSRQRSLSAQSADVVSAGSTSQSVEGDLSHCDTLNTSAVCHSDNVVNTSPSSDQSESHTNYQGEDIIDPVSPGETSNEHLSHSENEEEELSHSENEEQHVSESDCDNEDSSSSKSACDILLKSLCGKK